MVFPTPILVVEGRLRSRHFLCALRILNCLHFAERVWKVRTVNRLLELLQRQIPQTLSSYDSYLLVVASYNSFILNMGGSLLDGVRKQLFGTKNTLVVRCSWDLNVHPLTILSSMDVHLEKREGVAYSFHDMPHFHCGLLRITLYRSPWCLQIRWLDNASGISWLALRCSILR